MEKIDRTGEVITNARGQVCRIIAYHNNKNIDVEIIDTKANKIHTLYFQRYQRFKNGKIFFLPHLQGEDYMVARKPQPPKLEEKAWAVYSPAYSDLVEKEATGKAIGYTLGGALLVLAMLVVIAIAYLW